MGCSVVVTTGGTGPAPRDVTPEATEAVSTAANRTWFKSQSQRGCASGPPCSPWNAHLLRALLGEFAFGKSEAADPLQVCSRMMPGFGEQMRAISLKCAPLTAHFNMGLAAASHTLLLHQRCETHPRMHPQVWATCINPSLCSSTRCLLLV